MKEVIKSLFIKYGLGELKGDITTVSGGLMHKMFKVQTDKGTYAVKCLNPEIMKRPGVFDNYKRAETLESILEKNKIPIVPALTFNGKKMLEEDGRYFYIFNWQEGHITDPDNITKGQCYKAGEILGRIHAIQGDIEVHPCTSEHVELRPVTNDSEVHSSTSEHGELHPVVHDNNESSAPELSNIDFHAYLENARKQESNISRVLEENLELLKYAQNQLNEARKKLPPMKAISNDDMDAKNIMWHNGEPFVIDLECLDYSNPISSCLDLSLQWAGTVNEKFNSDNLKAFYNGYLDAYDNGFRSYDELYGIAYKWLEWLEYNLKRALGIEGTTDEDINLGASETINTISRIKYLHSLEKDIQAVLKSL